MAGRRATLKAIDWMAFAERVPPNQRAMFNALKTRSDALSAKLTSLPEKPPAIDWVYYKTAVAKAGMVDEFEKKYSALKVPEPVDTQTDKITAQEQEAYNALEVPEPVDTQTDKINAQEQEATKSAAEYVQASKSRIVQHEKQLEKFRTMIPFDQMTFEDLNEVFPETKLDKEKYPYWPIEDLQICLKAVSDLHV
ncbi:unnamed protein product [Lepidochelys kempii]